jgi:hypothetical protein
VNDDRPVKASKAYKALQAAMPSPTTREAVHGILLQARCEHIPSGYRNDMIACNLGKDEYE